MKGDTWEGYAAEPRVRRVVGVKGVRVEVVNPCPIRL